MKNKHTIVYSELLDSFDSNTVTIKDCIKYDNIRSTIYTNGRVIYEDSDDNNLLIYDFDILNNSSFGYVKNTSNKDLYFYKCIDGVLTIHDLTNNRRRMYTLPNKSYYVKPRSVIIVDGEVYCIIGNKVNENDPVEKYNIINGKYTKLTVKGSGIFIKNELLYNSTVLFKNDGITNPRRLVRNKTITKELIDISFNNDQIIALYKDGTVEHLQLDIVSSTISRNVIGTNFKYTPMMIAYTTGIQEYNHNQVYPGDPARDYRLYGASNSYTISNYDDKLKMNYIDANISNNNNFNINNGDDSGTYFGNKSRHYNFDNDDNIVVTNIIMTDSGGVTPINNVHYNTTRNIFNFKTHDFFRNLTNKKITSIPYVYATVKHIMTKSPKIVHVSKDGNTTTISCGRSGVILMRDGSFIGINNHVGFPNKSNVEGAIFGDDGYLYINCTNNYIIRNVYKDRYDSFFNVIVNTLELNNPGLDDAIYTSKMFSEGDNIWFFSCGKHTEGTDVVSNNWLFRYDSKEDRLYKIKNLNHLSSNDIINNCKLFVSSGNVLFMENSYGINIDRYNAITGVQIDLSYKDTMFSDNLLPNYVECYATNNNAICGVMIATNSGEIEAFTIDNGSYNIVKRFSLFTNVATAGEGYGARLCQVRNKKPYIGKVYIDEDCSISTMVIAENKIKILYKGKFGLIKEKLLNIPLTITKESYIDISKITNNRYTIEIKNIVNKSSFIVYDLTTYDNIVNIEYNKLPIDPYFGNMEFVNICNIVSSTGIVVKEDLIVGDNGYCDFGACNTVYRDMPKHMIFRQDQNDTNVLVSSDTIDKFKFANNFQDYIFVAYLGENRYCSKTWVGKNTQGQYFLLQIHNANGIDKVVKQITDSNLTNDTVYTTRVKKWILGTYNNSAVGFIYKDNNINNPVEFVVLLTPERQMYINVNVNNQAGFIHSSYIYDDAILLDNNMNKLIIYCKKFNFILLLSRLGNGKYYIDYSDMILDNGYKLNINEIYSNDVRNLSRTLLEDFNNIEIVNIVNKDIDHKVYFKDIPNIYRKDDTGTLEQSIIHSNFTYENLYAFEQSRCSNDSSNGILFKVCNDGYLQCSQFMPSFQQYAKDTGVLPNINPNDIQSARDVIELGTFSQVFAGDEDPYKAYDIYIEISKDYGDWYSENCVNSFLNTITLKANQRSSVDNRMDRTLFWVKVLETKTSNIYRARVDFLDPYYVSIINKIPDNPPENTVKLIMSSTYYKKSANIKFRFYCHTIIDNGIPTVPSVFDENEDFVCVKIDDVDFIRRYNSCDATIIKVDPQNTWKQPVSYVDLHDIPFKLDSSLNCNSISNRLHSLYTNFILTIKIQPTQIEVNRYSYITYATINNVSINLDYTNGNIIFDVSGNITKVPVYDKYNMFNNFLYIVVDNISNSSFRVRAFIGKDKQDITQGLNIIGLKGSNIKYPSNSNAINVNVLPRYFGEIGPITLIKYKDTAPNKVGTIPDRVITGIRNNESVVYTNKLYNIVGFMEDYNSSSFTVIYTPSNSNLKDKNKIIVAPLQGDSVVFENIIDSSDISFGDVGYYECDKFKLLSYKLKGTIHNVFIRKSTNSGLIPITNNLVSVAGDNIVATNNDNIVTNEILI